MRLFILTLLYSLLLGAIPLQAQHTIGTFNMGVAIKGQNPFTVKVESLHSRLTAVGYIPLRITVQNRVTLDKTFTISTLFKDQSYGSDFNSAQAQFQIQSSSGQTTITDILVPTVYGESRYGNLSSNLEVTVSTTGLPSENSSMSTSYDENWPNILISDKLSTLHASSLNKQVETHLGSHRSGNIEFGSSFDPQAAAQDWRAYLAYQSLLTTSEEWKKINPTAKNAIHEWIRFGGEIYIYDKTGTATIEQLGLAQLPANSVHIYPTGQKYDLAQNQLVKELSKRFDHPVTNLNDFDQSKWSLSKKLGEKAFQPTLFIIFLIAFGIIVGPINLFVWAKAGRRHRLFITTPLISIIASLLLLFVIIIQDGFGGKGFYRSIINVHALEEENQLYITQEQISRTGILLGQGFQEKNSQVMTPIPLNDSRWARVSKTQNQNNRYQIRNRKPDGKSYSGNWFQSRSEQAHLLQAIVPSRERIEILTTTSGAPQALSSFQFPIGTFFYQDAKGVFWTAPSLQQGQKVTLQRSSFADCRAWSEPTDFKKIARLITPPREVYLIPSKKHFIAELPSPPQIDTLKSIRWTALPSLLQGSALIR